MNKLGAYALSLLAIVIMFAIGVVSTRNHYQEKMYINNGYEQVMVVGSGMHKWQKIQDVVQFEQKTMKGVTE